MKAGAAAVHFEDQLSSAKNAVTWAASADSRSGRRQQTGCRTPCRRHSRGVQHLSARTDAESGNLLSSDIDPRDRDFIVSENRTDEGFFHVRNGLDYTSIMRGLASCVGRRCTLDGQTKPDLEVARKFAEAIHAQYPANCWPITAHPLIQLAPQPRRGHDRETFHKSWARWVTNSSL